jgi:predicted ester cyclase
MTNQCLKNSLSHFINEVWNIGDIQAATKYLASSYTIHHDPGDPWEGRVLDSVGYKERVAVSRAPFPDQHFDIQGIFADGDTVVMTWLWRATHLADIPMFPATGKPIQMSGATAYFFDSTQRLTGHCQITDRLGVFRQL